MSIKLGAGWVMGIKNSAYALWDVWQCVCCSTHCLI